MERMLEEAAGAGTLLDLGIPEADEPRRAVAAQALFDLLTGRRGVVRSVRLQGAHITGSLDLESMTLVCPLLLSHCTFDEPVVLHGVRGSDVNLSGCHAPGIFADGLDLGGTLRLLDVDVPGGVSLAGARIGGHLCLDGARLGAAGNGSAFCGDGLVVDQSVLFRSGFQASGEVRMLGARIAGFVELDSAQLNNPDGVALFADNITADRITFGSGSVAHGAVRLMGGRVEGALFIDDAVLSFPGKVALDMENMTVAQTAFLRRATVDGELRLGAAHVRGHLVLDGTTVTNPGGHAVSADQLTVGGALVCTGRFTTNGELRVMSANVGGRFELQEARLNNPGGHALVADQLTVGNAMIADGLVANGTVRLYGAHIRAHLGFVDVTVNNPQGSAIEFEHLTVEQAAFLSRLDATGAVWLTSARIAGRLLLDGVRLANPGGWVLGLNGAHASELVLLPAAPPDGDVDLTNATVGNFVDDPATWAEVMHLRGFTYDKLGNETVDVRTRLRWVAGHDGYLPGLYDQLESTYRRGGRLESARLVAIAKQRRRRRELNRFGRVWNWLLYLTVGYGYRPWLAGVWLAGLLAVGSAVFAAAHPAHVRAVSAGPDFQPVVYTLDLLLPIVDLGQEKAWFAQGWALGWSWVLIVAGWALSTAVVVGITNALKRD